MHRETMRHALGEGAVRLGERPRIPLGHELWRRRISTSLRLDAWDAPFNN